MKDLRKYHQALAKDLVKSLSDQEGLTEEEALWWLVRKLVVAFRAKRKIPEMTEVQLLFDEVEQERSKAVARQKKRKEIQEDQAPLEGFDLAQLDREPDGTYRGVSAHGSGFRAKVQEPNSRSWKYLPTRRTAERAAFDRFKWYRDRDLPYSAWEKRVCSVTMYPNSLSQAFSVEAQMGTWMACARCGEWDIMPDKRPADDPHVLGEYNYDKADLMKRFGVVPDPDGDRLVQEAVERAQRAIERANQKFTEQTGVHFAVEPDSDN